MQDIKKLINAYLGKSRMLQIATSVDNQPWICTVYYAFDENWNIYWISTPQRRHSKEISKNAKVAATTAFSQEPYPENGVQVIAIEGIAKLLIRKDEEEASKLYIKQLKREKTLLEDIRSGKNPHKFYRLKPKKFVLFDSVHFPKNPRQELKI